MTKYEYRAIPFPGGMPRDRALSGGADPHAEALSLAINDLAADGWEYLRADSVVVDARRVLGANRQQRSFLVFRREARPLVEMSRVVDFRRDIEKVRARRVKSDARVEFIRSGGRRITPEPDGPLPSGDISAAE